MTDDRKRLLWLVLAVLVVIAQNLHSQAQAERARAAAMVDAAEVIAVVRASSAQPASTAQGRSGSP